MEIGSRSCRSRRHTHTHRFWQICYQGRGRICPLHLHVPWIFRPSYGPNAHWHSDRLGPYSCLSTIFTATGIPWVSKNPKKYFTNKIVGFCARIELLLKKLRKTVKTEKNCQKCLFSDSFLNFLQFKLDLRAKNHRMLIP
jgi:hypothetical protein